MHVAFVLMATGWHVGLVDQVAAQNSSMFPGCVMRATLVIHSAVLLTFAQQNLEHPGIVAQADMGCCQDRCRH
jgi:hypothetical protein